MNFFHLKSKIIFFIILFSFLFLSLAVFADSPITSTDFYEAYFDVDMVKNAKDSGVLNNEIAGFLASPVKPLDQKAAVVNALSWKFEGKDNAQKFQKFLMKKYRKNEKTFKLEILSGGELLSLGYLTVMDDYFHPQKSIPILEKAQSKLKNSFTAAMILALAKSQAAMDSNWCDVWKFLQEVLQDPKLKRDMRVEAIQVVVEYVRLYEKDCK